jgi:DNA-binding LytR/AlgR family response regulator
MRINTLIVDDNLVWQKIISKFVQLNPILSLVGVCGSAMEAYAKLVDGDIDLLICDIEMPEMSGLQFVKSLRITPMVIFVSAHRDYALDCYEVSPVDFLLKPLDINRFLKSIEKVRLRYLNQNEIVEIEPYFFIRENLNNVQIPYKDVIYMKAQENFLQIVTSTKSFLPILSISKMEEQIKGDRFLRVHRSFLVNRSEISLIGKNEIMLSNGLSIPIGDQYRTQINRKHLDGNLVTRNT